jgi:hypothetical protein
MLQALRRGAEVPRPRPQKLDKRGDPVPTGYDPKMKLWAAEDHNPYPYLRYDRLLLCVAVAALAVRVALGLSD